MKLVIVESPTKKLTIQKYLGEDYKVEASIGHIRDLAMTGQYNLGVKIYDGFFTPTYEILPGKEPVVEKLKKLADEAEFVYLASDPDREGEAIAWHLSKVLDLQPGKFKRLEFHEITRHAIQNAVDNPRDLNDLKIDAQEARRIVDRILGFRISYVLARDTSAPSAGRVQSATLRLIYDREVERNNFKPVTTYFVKAVMEDEKGRKVEANLVDKNGDKIKFPNETAADIFIKNLSNNITYKGETKEEKVVNSKAPFTLSELYQTANSMYHYSTKVILAAAKALFENGYITYPRTDSHRLAPEFINKTKAYINDKYGEQYVGVAKGQYGNTGQDAHEALRPTDLSVSSKEFTGKLDTASVRRVYDLIYNRTVQSMMQPRVENEITYNFESNGNKFQAKKTVVIFKGFSVVDGSFKDNFEYQYTEGKEYPYENEKYSDTTTPPPQYTEGSLVKKMEETGIGRPSTYATMVSTLLDRGYVKNEKGFLQISRMGNMVAEYLNKHFPNTVVNIQYTSEMESKLDDIEEQKISKLETITNINDYFLDEFNEAVRNPEPPKPLITGEKCPVCGGDLVYKYGKMGEFIGCSNYPNCHYIKVEEVGRVCPECGHPLVYKNSKNGQFIGCSNYPNCHYMEAVKKKKTFKKKATKKTKEQ